MRHDAAERLGPVASRGAAQERKTTERLRRGPVTAGLLVAGRPLWQTILPPSSAQNVHSSLIQQAASRRLSPRFSFTLAVSSSPPHQQHGPEQDCPRPCAKARDYPHCHHRLARIGHGQRRSGADSVEQRTRDQSGQVCRPLNEAFLSLAAFNII